MNSKTLTIESKSWPSSSSYKTQQFLQINLHLIVKHCRMKKYKIYTLLKGCSKYLIFTRTFDLSLFYRQHISRSINLVYMKRISFNLELLQILLLIHTSIWNFLIGVSTHYKTMKSIPSPKVYIKNVHLNKRNLA
jgi:hypothetical protein